MSIKSRIGSMMIFGGGAALATSIAVAPQSAFALGWSVDSMLGSTGVSNAGVGFKKISQNDFADWVEKIATVLLGFAIVAVVLRVVLTAIDRLVFKNSFDKGGGRGGRPGGGDDDTLLSKIPLIGAYKPDVEWKKIIGNMFIQLCIVVGAWVGVRIIVGVVQMLFQSLGASGTK